MENEFQSIDWLWEPCLMAACAEWLIPWRRCQRWTPIKQWQTDAYQISDIVRAEKLYNLPAIGDRKLLEIIVAMLEICPRDDESTNLFACLFLQRLPREIGVIWLLDNKNPKTLAEEADSTPFGLSARPAPIICGPGS
jgi:hypothetical protein